MPTKNKHIPVIGTIYGQWTIISTTIKDNGSSNDRNTYWNVECSCGKKTFRSASALVAGKTKACMSCTKTVYNSNTYIHAYFNRLQYRIEKLGFETDIDVEYLEELFRKQEGKCALSGIILEFKPFKQLSDTTASLDRIDSTKGYIKGNVQWVHKDINMMKGLLTQIEFINLCKLVAGHSKC